MISSPVMSNRSKGNRQRVAGGDWAALAGCGHFSRDYRVARPAHADEPWAIGNGSLRMTMRLILV
jgi:hypothetical protein